jgi:hypothetical protein
MRPFMYQEGVELIVPANPAGVGLVNFPDIPELRSDTEKDIIIRSMEVFPSEAVPFTFSGNISASTAQIANAFLTLYIGGVNKVYRIPLIKMVNLHVGGTDPGSVFFWVNEISQMENYKVDWTKSYLSFPVPIIAATQFSYLFSISYDKLPPGTIAKAKLLRAQRLDQGVINS